MTGVRLMIVEDEALVALDLKSRLEDLGYVIAARAADGSEAIAQARQTAPDLVLMDIRLGNGPDGIETAEALRKELAAPVVFVTAHSDEATLLRAKVSDPFGFVLKPFRDRDLQIVIEMALHRHRADLEQERLVRELRRALARVKTLERLLPICMHCKRIRDDEGYWMTIDAYITKHTDVQFSHGICQVCLTERYSAWTID